MTDRAKLTLEEALAMSNHEFAEAFLNCEIKGTGYRYNESRAVLEAKLDDVARKARLEGK